MRYVIGDVQGCYQELLALLKHIRFNDDCDQLFFVGDLVNRGPDSLSVLRYLYCRRDNLVSVLGNHDLHLLAVADKTRLPSPKDTLDPILVADDKEPILDWLRQMPLALHLPQEQVLISHAGLYPGWSIEQALAFSSEVQAVLQSDERKALFQRMYSNQPSHWQDTLSGWPRLIFIINAFTRMRYLTSDLGLDMSCKLPIGQQPAGLKPWFDYIATSNKTSMIFGHWAALEGHTGHPKAIATDTGCVWGGGLTAYCLETGERLTVPYQSVMR